MRGQAAGSVAAAPASAMEEERAEKEEEKDRLRPAWVLARSVSIRRVIAARLEVLWQRAFAWVAAVMRRCSVRISDVAAKAGARWQRSGGAADLAAVKMHESLWRSVRSLTAAALGRARSLLRSYRRAALAAGLCAVLLLGSPLASQLPGTSALLAPPVAIELRHEEAQRLKALDSAKPGVVFVCGESRGGEERCRTTGWVFGSEGLVVTCLSGIDAAARGSLSVRFMDQTQVPARVVGVDRGSDLAVLEVRMPAGARLHPLPRAAPDSLLLGQDLYVMGNPHGLDHTLARGVLSGMGRSLLVEGQLPVQGAIQTDASIHPGNRGGPVLTSRGEVAGMATAAARLAGARVSPGVGESGAGGLAVPIETVAARVRSIVEYGYVPRPNLGLHLGPDDLAGRLGVQGGGAIVMEVMRGSPAREAGVCAGDVLMAFDGQPVRRAEDIVEALSSREPGETVQLTLRRPIESGGEVFSPGTQYKEIDVLVRLGEDQLSR